MNYPIAEIEGIGATYAEKLGAQGIDTTEKLLAACATPKGRKETAEKTGIAEGHLLRWANMADLMRLKGVGKQYAELLEAAGVDTVKELKHRNAANLAAKMKEVNEAKKISGNAPTEEMVGGWIAQAKELPAVMAY
jgi:predicted flap endonuclease-1-like 5' DNA nuclease